MPLDEAGARNKYERIDSPSIEMSTARYLVITNSILADHAEGERRFNSYRDSPPPPDIPEIIKFDHVVTGHTPKLSLADAHVCIYCGYDPERSREKRTLTEEHIIPRSIGGNIVVKNSSCSVCQPKIGKYEDRINSFFLFAPARQLGITGKKRARRISKERPETYFLDFRINGKSERVPLLAEDHPTIITLPIMNCPTIIPQPTVPFAHVAGSWSRKIRSGENIVRKRGDITFTTTIDTLSVWQYIAKISYSYIAALALSHGGFFLNGLIKDALPTFASCIPEITPYVTNVYNDEQHDMSIFSYVGGDPVIYKKSDFLHGLGHSVISDKNGAKYAVVYVRLFGNLGSPIYVCVIGKIPAKATQPIRF